MYITNYSPIPCYSPNYKSKTSVSINRSNFQTSNTDQLSFCGLPRILADKTANTLYNPLKNFREFSKAEYSTLSQNQLKVLRKRFEHLTDRRYGYFYKNTEIIHDNVSDSIINSLDEKYGKDKYNIVILGRSMSSLGKVIGYKIGENRVINVPISQAGQYNSENALKNVNFSYLRTNLRFLGLTDEVVNSPNTKLVVMDYCCSGDSLKGGTQLLRKTFDNEKNILSENPQNLVDNPILSYALNCSLVDSIYKDFSFVHRASDVSRCANSVKNLKDADYETKLVWFKLLDNVMTNKKSKIEDLNIEHVNLIRREI